MQIKYDHRHEHRPAAHRWLKERFNASRKTFRKNVLKIEDPGERLDLNDNGFVVVQEVLKHKHVANEINRVNLANHNMWEKYGKKFNTTHETFLDDITKKYLNSADQRVQHIGHGFKYDPTVGFVVHNSSSEDDQCSGREDGFIEKDPDEEADGDGGDEDMDDEEYYDYGLDQDSEGGESRASRAYTSYGTEYND